MPSKRRDRPSKQRRPGPPPASRTWPVALTLSIGFATHALAQAPPPDPRAVAIRVVFDAPPGCPSRDDLVASVFARTSRARIAADYDPAARTFEVGVRHGDQGYVGSLRSRTKGSAPSDAREVGAASCDEVVRALSLTIALGIDPDASTGLVPAPGAPVPAPTPARAPASAEVGPRGQSRPWSIALGATVIDLASRGLLVGPVIAGEYRGGDESAPGASIRLEARAATEVDDGASERRQFTFGSLGLAACPWAFRVGGPLVVRPCVRADAGALGARGENLTHPSTSTVPWVDGGLDVRLGVGLGGGFEAEVSGAAVVALVRPTFVFESPHTEVARVWPVSPSGGVGVAYRFR